MEIPKTKKEKSTTTPLLETSNVEIKYLTSGSEGVSVKTNGVLARKALGRPSLTPDQTSRLREAFRSESKFQGIDDYEKIRVVHGTHSSEAKTAWQQYRERAIRSKKLGIRNIELDTESGLLSVDILNIPYPVYKVLAWPENSPELRAFAEAAGTASAIVTSDEKLIIQHRLVSKLQPGGGMTRGNVLYADVPGASAGGMLDAQPGINPSVPAEIDTNSVTANILKEIDEELGLDTEDVSDIKLVGIASDKIQPHDELLFYSTTPLTMEEVYAKSKESNRNRVLGDADFEEKFLAINATPQAIETLLVEVKAPVPPTHSACIFATGYALVLEKSGKDAANAWAVHVQDGMRKNHDAISELIKNHYAQHPEALTTVPDRYMGKSTPVRNTEGYTPEYTPEEQGLPTLYEELKRTGLVQ